MKAVLVNSVAMSSVDRTDLRPGARGYDHKAAMSMSPAMFCAARCPEKQAAVTVAGSSVHVASRPDAAPADGGRQHVVIGGGRPGIM